MSTTNRTSETTTRIVSANESRLGHNPSHSAVPTLGSEHKERLRVKIKKQVASASNLKGMSIEEYKDWFPENVRKETARLPELQETMRRDEERMREMVPRVATALLEEFGLDSMEENWDPKKYEVYLYSYFKLLYKVRIHFHLRPIPHPFPCSSTPPLSSCRTHPTPLLSPILEL